MLVLMDQVLSVIEALLDIRLPLLVSVPPRLLDEVVLPPAEGADLEEFDTILRIVADLARDLLCVALLDIMFCPCYNKTLCWNHPSVAT